MRKEIESDLSWRARIPGSVSVALVFGGLFSLGVSRVLVVYHLSPGMTILSVTGGILLCALGLFVRDRKSRQQ